MSIAAQVFKTSIIVFLVLSRHLSNRCRYVTSRRGRDVAGGLGTWAGIGGVINRITPDDPEALQTRCDARVWPVELNMMKYSQILPDTFSSFPVSKRRTPLLGEAWHDAGSGGGEKNEKYFRRISASLRK